MLLNHDSEGNPNGKFWTGNIAGAWTNTAAVEAMNEALGTAFVDADFAAGTNLVTTDPGPGDAHSYLNLTFTNAKKNTLELYAAVTGRNGALDNVTVTGLTNVIISYAVGDGDGFVSEPTFSPDILGVTLVKIQGYLGDDKQVTVTSTSMAGEASAKNGFQIAGYTFTDEELPLVIESMAVVGTFPGMTWEPTEGIAMTKDAENPAVWTVTMEGVEVEGKQYEYKVTANGKWGAYEIPAQGNQDFVFGTDEYPAGVYNLTFTANTSENTLELVAEKAETATDFVEITVTDAVSDENGNYITFSSPYALDFTDMEGIKAYTGKKNILYDATNFKDIAEVILTPVDKVPAYTGVLIKASEAKTYQVPVASQPVDALADNDFVAAIEKTDLFPLCDGYIKGVATLQTAEYEVFDWNTYENVNETGTGFFLLDVPAEEGVDFLEEGDVYLPIVANETCNEVDEVKYYCHYVKLVFTDVELPVVENIAALKAMDNETIATLKFAENTLVTYVGTDFIAIEDNTGGIFLQNPGIDVTEGKTLTGQLTGQLDKASTYPVLSNCTLTDASTIVVSEETTELNPAVVTFNQAFGDDHLMRLVKLENVTVVKEDEYSSMCKFVDQEGTELEINDLFGALTLEMMDLKDGDLLLSVEGYAYIIDESSFYANWLGINQFQPVRMTKQHTYSIVGEFFATDDNDGWTNDQDMVQSEDNENVYTLTVDKFTAEARTYEYKLRADHVWGIYELPAQGNQNWVFGTEGYPAGDYKLTFTANVADNTLELNVEALDAPSTGINEVSTDWSDGNTYNLNGQRIDTPRKGVVIRNGKKVIIR